MVTLLEGVKVLAIENDNLREKNGVMSLLVSKKSELVTNVIPVVTQLLQIKIKWTGNCVKRKKLNKKRRINISKNVRLCESSLKFITLGITQEMRRNDQIIKCDCI